MSARPPALGATPAIFSRPERDLPRALEEEALPLDHAIDGSKPTLFTLTPGATIDRPVVELRRADAARVAAYAFEAFDALRAAALERLAAVQAQVGTELATFDDLDGPAWQAFEAAVEQDRALAERHGELANELNRLRLTIGYAPRARSSQAMVDRDRARFDAVTEAMARVAVERTGLCRRHLPSRWSTPSVSRHPRHGRPSSRP